MSKKNIHCYDDIIDLPAHQSKTHPQMSMDDRAAQFAPFAALNGYAQAINETGRIVQAKRFLSEYEQNVLHDQLSFLNTKLNENPLIQVVYFIQDTHKSGGKYHFYQGILKKIDDVKQVLVFVDQTTILFENLYSISGEILNFFEESC